MPAALRRLLDQRAEPLSPRLRTTLLVLAAAGVVVASVWAWRSSGLTFDDIDWLPIALAFLLAAPASLGLKALEFRVAARIAGQEPAGRRSLDVAVAGGNTATVQAPDALVVDPETSIYILGGPGGAQQCADLRRIVFSKP